MDYDYDIEPIYGSGTLWGTEMNQRGFMGFVDKSWIFTQRIGIILCICAVVISIVTVIALSIKIKEGYDLSMSRQQLKIKYK